MKINHIDARNFLGLPRLSLPIESTLVCICGDNGAGKSSLIDAIRFAIEGTSPRGVTLKKNFDTLISDGSAGASYCAVTIDSTNIRRNTKDGKLAAQKGEPIDTSRLHFSLDAQAFAQLEPDKRRTFLFGLMDVSMSQAAVAAELKEEGIPKFFIDEVVPMLRGGFPGAATYAAEQATIQRGVWRGVTGEKTYGSKIAEGWAAPVPEEVDAAELERAKGIIAAAKVSAATAGEAVIRGNLQRQQRAAAEARRPTEEALAQLRADLEAAEAAQVALGEQLEAARVAASGPSGVTGPCPCCKALLAVVDGQFVENKSGGGAASPQAIARVQQLAADQRTSMSALLNLRTKVATAESNAAAMLPDAPTDEEIADLEEQAEQQRHRLAELEAETRGLIASNERRAAALTLTASAKTAHENVLGWERTRDLLLPEGIPGRIVGKALGPINAKLSGYASATDWKLAQILPGMGITYGGRDYGLCSESEQWRADTMIAAAIAQQAGNGILVLDRMDVLEPSARGQLWGWLLEDAENWGTVLVAGTLKEPPAALQKAGVQVVWLDDTITAAAAA